MTTAIQWSAITASDGVFNSAVSTTAVALTLPAYYTSSGVVSGAAFVLVRDAAILWKANGTDPTAADEATGDKASVGDRVFLESLSEIKNFSCIRATGTNGAIFVTFLRRMN